MEADEAQKERPDEPRGLGEHARGLASEYAHEQGWGLDEDQRTRLPESPGDADGGSHYEYGARDFGDEPVNTARFGDAADSGKDAGTNSGTGSGEKHEE